MKKVRILTSKRSLNEHSRCRYEFYGYTKIWTALRESILGHLVKPNFAETAFEHALRRKGTRNESKKDIQCSI